MPFPLRQLPARPQVELEPVKPETLHLATDLPYGLAVAAFRWPGSNSPDFAAAQVLADVLGGQRSSLRELVPRGQALSASFSFDNFPEASLAYAQAAFPAGGDGAVLLHQVREILGDIARNGVPAELVDAAKRHEVADAEFKKNSISDLAMFWSDAVALEGRHSPGDDIEAIQKVTVEDVKRVASPASESAGIDIGHSDATGLRPADFIVVIRQTRISCGHRERGRSASRLGTEGESALRTSFECASASHDTVEWIKTDRAAGDGKRHGQRLRPCPENSGLKHSKGKEGVDEVLDELLSYGTVSLDRAAFQKALDDIGANESAGADFSLEVPAGDFDRGVALLAENELHPALPAGAFKIVQRQLADRMAGEVQSPAYLTEHALESALLPKNDPDLRHPTSRSISSLSLADVRNYYKRVFQPDLTTIVVVGNITPERARSVIERNFGNWKSHGPRPRTHLSPVRTNQPSSLEVPNASRVQAEVTLAETLPVTRSDPDYYTLNLGSQVLGGAFYASRLSRDLRENSGLVYSVSSTLAAEPTRDVLRPQLRL